MAHSYRSADALDPVVKRLREIGKKSPALKEAALMYEAVLPLLRDTNLNAAPVLLTPRQARRKMQDGLPLLDGLKLEVDLHDACELMSRLVWAIEKSVGNPYVRDVRMALEEGRLNVGILLSQAADGQMQSVVSLADGLGLDPDLLRTLARFCLRPVFHVVRKHLEPLVEGVAWDRGICYICGAGASLAELRGNNQMKHLRCGQCGADWPIRRLQCARCNNEDHLTLGYLSTDKNEETSRIEVCERCRGYVKVIVSFSPSPAEMLPVEDLATLQFDYIAQGRGYSSFAQMPFSPGH